MNQLDDDIFDDGPREHGHTRRQRRFKEARSSRSRPRAISA